MDEYHAANMDDLKRAYKFALSFWGGVIAAVASGAGWLIWNLVR